MIKKIAPVTILIILTLSLFVIPLPMSSTQNAEWEDVERGANFIRKHKIGTDTYSWESASQWVFDGSEWVPYILETNPDYYQVQSGLIGARIYRGKVVFYSPDLLREAVGRENWLVYKNVDGVWNPVCASLQKYYQSSSVSEGVDDVNITAVWSTPKGELEIIYQFREKLKHTVTWTPTEAGRFAMVQFWNDTQYTDVTLGNKTIIKRTDDYILGSTDSLTFLFGGGTQPFGIFENQYSARELLHKTIFAKGTVNYQGISITDGVAWIFFNNTLSDVGVGESIVIDPDTISLSTPTKDAHYAYNGFEYAGEDYLSSDAYHNPARIAIEWDISGIPDGKNVTDVIFKYHGWVYNLASDAHVREMMGTRPSTSGGSSIYAEAGEGTIYVDPSGFPEVGTNKQVDLGPDADSDLEDNLVADWFAIGIRDDDEDYEHYIKYARIYAQEYASVNPSPTLYVEYEDPTNYTPTITSATITDMDDTDNVYAMNQYYTFQVMVNDLNGASNISSVHLQCKQGATVRFEVRATNLNTTPAFAIQTGASIIDLDTVACSWGEAGNVGIATFSIRIEWDYIPDENDLELAVYVEDSGGLSAGFTDKQTDYFDIIARLVTTGFESNATYVQVNGPVELFGYVRYCTTVDGIESSSSYPPDAEFVAVHIHDSSHVSQGSDAAIVDGYFSIEFNIPGVVQANVYHVFLDMGG